MPPHHRHLVPGRVAGAIAPLVALLVVVASAHAQECADCHDEVTVPLEAHAAFGCPACHAGMEEFPHADEAIEAGRAHTACATCHDAPEALSQSVHAGLGCQECHGPAHEMLPSSDSRSTMSVLKQFQSCGRCHEADDRVARYLGSPHGKAVLLKGLVNAPACSNCHGSHTVLPSSSPESRLSRAHAPTTCGECHRFVLETWESESAHGAAWAESNPKAPVCTTCHPSHSLDVITERATVLDMPSQCGDCHGARYSSYRDNFHGKATDLGFTYAAVCSDCHGAHRNLPASDPRSTVNPAHLQETCGTCHRDPSPAFVSFHPHLEPSDPNGSPPVHAVWRFMTALLLGVFGFFAVHDLLWLQRATVGWWRGEYPTRPMSPGPYVRRFRQVHVWVHLVVVVTFLTLAITGLPLKYHATPWAQAIAALPGGLGWMRILHRLAAIVTFGYLGFHFAHLVYRRRHGESGLFWGWRSMVPRPQDVADFLRNLRYFLYLGPRPRFDRWGYWEKFDYFAVLWGVPVIGLSGLVLWFPRFFTFFLPGWTLNAAFVIHSDEALLATGFIFIFHFFHTHLRPESFPLDPVIFTGRMPLERMREERPLEYERLVESGDLEKHLVPPPSELEIQVAVSFGAAALVTGLLLVVAIFWGVLAA